MSLTDSNKTNEKNANNTTLTERNWNDKDILHFLPKKLINTY